MLTFFLWLYKNCKLVKYRILKSRAEFIGGTGGALHPDLELKGLKVPSLLFLKQLFFSNQVNFLVKTNK